MYRAVVWRVQKMRMPGVTLQLRPMYLWDTPCDIRRCSIIMVFTHVLERLKAFGLLGDNYKIIKKILWQA